MFSVTTGIAGAVVVSLFGIGAAEAACGTGRLKMNTTFETLPKTWGVADEFMSVKDGKLVVSEKNGDFYVVIAGPTFENADYCAEVVLTETSDPAASYGGLTFWATDVDHFHTFQITLDGYATVYEYTGQWHSVIKDKPVSSIKTGVGAVNELRVLLEGNRATLFINGEAFDSIVGTAPAGGSHIGFTIEAPQNGNATFALDNVEVRDVAVQ